jgi:hypothetical protein
LHYSAVTETGKQLLQRQVPSNILQPLEYLFHLVQHKSLAAVSSFHLALNKRGDEGTKSQTLQGLDVLQRSGNMQSIRRQMLARPYSPALAGTKKAHSLQQESYHIKVKCSHKQRSSVKGKRYLGRDQASPTLFSNVRKSTSLSLYSQPYRYHLLVLPKIKNQPTPQKT